MRCEAEACSRILGRCEDSWQAWAARDLQSMQLRRHTSMPVHRENGGQVMSLPPVTPHSVVARAVGVGFRCSLAILSLHGGSLWPRTIGSGCSLGLAFKLVPTCGRKHALLYVRARFCCGVQVACRRLCTHPGCGVDVRAQAFAREYSGGVESRAFGAVGVHTRRGADERRSVT